MAFHPTSAIDFHYRVFGACKLGLQYINDASSSSSSVQSFDILPVCQYAWKWLLFVFMRGYATSAHIKQWLVYWCNLFSLGEPSSDISQFPFEQVLPAANWIIDMVTHVKDEPKSSTQKEKEAETKKENGPSATSGRFIGPMPKPTASRSQDDLSTSSKPKSAKRDRDRSLEDGDYISWADIGGDDDLDDDYAHTMPPFDAPNSILWQYLIASPQYEVRDAMYDILVVIVDLLTRYQHAARDNELAPMLAKLADHLVTLIPYLPYYASKSLDGYLHLLIKMCKSSQLLLHRFLCHTPAIPNNLLARLLDLWMGGVDTKENPCANTINRMPVDGKMRRYYPIDKVTLTDKVTWKRAFWSLVNLLVTHSDTTPLRTMGKESSDETNVNDQAKEENESSASAALPPTRAPSSHSRASSVDSTDLGFVDVPPVPLSSDCVRFFVFEKFLDAVLTESFQFTRMTPISQLMTRLAAENEPWSNMIVTALFQAIQTTSEPQPAYFTLIRALTNMEDSIRHQRLKMIFIEWIKTLEADQMYWNPMNSSLDYMLTLLKQNDDFLSIFHSHIPQWQWLIHWCENNKSRPGFNSSPNGPTLDRPSRSSRSSSSLESSWASGSSWIKPNFQTQNLGSLGSANPFTSTSNTSNGNKRDRDTISPIDDAEDDEEDDSDDDTIYIGRDRLARYAMAGKSKSKPKMTRPPSSSTSSSSSIMMKPERFLMFEKWLMLRRMKNGQSLVPLSGEEDNDDAADADGEVSNDGWDVDPYAIHSSHVASIQPARVHSSISRWPRTSHSSSIGIPAVGSRTTNTKQQVATSPSPSPSSDNEMPDIRSSGHASTDGDEDDEEEEEEDGEEESVVFPSPSPPPKVNFVRGAEIDVLTISPQGRLWRTGVITTVKPDEKKFKVHVSSMNGSPTGDDIWLDFDQTKKYAPAKTMSITVSNKDPRAGITKDRRR